MPNPATMTAMEAKGLLGAVTPKPVPELQLMYDEDLFQNGKQYSGPIPDRPELRTPYVTEMERRWTPRNVVKEITDRHRDAVVGREVSWSFGTLRQIPDGEKRTPAEEEAIRTAEQAFVRWWNTKKIRAVLQTAVTYLLLHGRAPLRVFIPRSFLRIDRGEDGEPLSPAYLPRVSFEDALNKLSVEAPSPANAGRAVDPDTMVEVAILQYQDAGREVVEIAYVDETTGRTVYRSLSSSTVAGLLDRFRRLFGVPASNETTFALGGLLPVHEMRRQPFITDSIRRQQNALNFANTAIPFTVQTSAFVERLFTGAHVNGHLEKNPDGSPRFVPDPPQFGPMMVGFINGEDIKDAQGKVIGRETVNYHRAEPTGVEAPDGAKRSHYRDILEQAGQAHALITGDAVVTGEARKQALNEFRRSLLPTEPEALSAVEWLMKFALLWAEVLSGTEGQLSSLIRPVVAVRQDLGAPSAQDAQQNDASVRAGTLSRQTAMERNQVTEVDEEMDRIAADPMALDQVLNGRATRFAQIKAAEPNMRAVDAAIAAGWPEDEAEKRFGGVDEADAQGDAERKAIADALAKAGTPEGGDA